tara:strand:- start:254 stop:493 length:240 start_codon:yes stop_codon:yes gene_type:complete
MGYTRSYSVTKAAQEINAAAYDATDSKMDGYTCWGAKQDLYRLKWLLDDALSRCPKFSVEEEWLKEQEQQQLLNLLRKK